MEPWNVGNLQGLIPLLGGAYVWLLFNGTLPRNPTDPEKMDAWRAKYGGIVKVAAPATILLGILQLAGVL